MQSLAPTLCIAMSPPPTNSVPLTLSRTLNFTTPLSNSHGSLSHPTFDASKNQRILSVSSRFAGQFPLHQKSSTVAATGGGGSMSELNDDVRKLLQVFLWLAEAVYIVWLFLLPYAPGDPVWAISSDSINSLIGLSLNFFFILPLTNSVGIHLIEAPVLHPMSEGLFNFVIAWTLMFAPLLYTDRRRDGFKGSIDVLWGFQMFLTNTFLIPYMAFRLNEAEAESTPRKTSQLGSLMINGASIVGVTGGVVCLVSILWALYGRGDGNFGDLRERWEFLAWLIGDNMGNIEEDKAGLVNFLRFIPVVGLVAYCLCLDTSKDT